jgi:hypothetical protein
MSLFVVMLTACDDHTTVPMGSACGDPQQISLPSCNAGPDRFSDESCVPLDDAIRNNRTTTNDMRAATITAPTEMQRVPTATPFTFTFTAPMVFRRVPSRRPMTVADELHRLVTLVPEAHAHCDPFTGRGYELRFTVGSNVIFRRQQSATSYTPSAAEWQYLTRTIATGTAELSVYTAAFVSSQISAGAGPFVSSTPRRFMLAP